MDGEEGKVVYLADRRPAASPVAPAQEASSPSEKDTVFFVTGGRFECMVNNAVGAVGPGEFVRVAPGAVYAFAELGPGACTMVWHKFPAGAPSGLLRDIAGALPPFTPAFPRSGTPVFARLESIARRWGFRLDSNAAA